MTMVVNLGVKDFGNFGFWFIIDSDWQGWGFKQDWELDLELLVPTWTHGKLGVQNRDCLEVIG